MFTDDCSSWAVELEPVIPHRRVILKFRVYCKPPLSETEKYVIKLYQTLMLFRPKESSRNGILIYVHEISGI
jgi:hypothetical protein